MLPYGARIFHGMRPSDTHTVKVLGVLAGEGTAAGEARFATFTAVERGQMPKTLHCHPTEEAMERFLLHQSREGELESLESHILGCEGCVDRLERMEPEIVETKLALKQMLAIGAIDCETARGRLASIPDNYWPFSDTGPNQIPRDCLSHTAPVRERSSVVVN